MFVFYDWPFSLVYFAKNIATIIFPLIVGSVFSVVFYGDKHMYDTVRWKTLNLR